MRKNVARFLRLNGPKDEGAAMVIVIVLGMVMSLIVGIAVSAALSGSRSSKTDESWNAALSAAYAGVEEYKNRLANDSTYQKFGNPAATFSSTTGSVVSLPALNPNPAFGLGVEGSWAPVPGSEGRASFRYEVDNSQYGAKGILRIRSTGRVGTETRSIVADLKQKGFIDFLYFTDYELIDPDQSNKDCEPTHDWDVDHDSDCTEIEFGAGDTIDGPVHSNDTLKLCGTFKGIVTTSDTRSPNHSNECGGSSFPKDKDGKRLQVATVAPIGMPATNLTMKQETRSDLADVPKPGCLYTGPTTIDMDKTGTLTIRSPFTVKTRIAGDPATSGTTDAECGSIAALRSAAGAVISVPNQNLIYVQDVPSNPSDPNFWATNPANFDCVNTTTGGWKFPKISPVITFPRTGTPTAERKPEVASPRHYGCRAGDVFVKGTLRGALTIAAQNYVYITGDVLYDSPDADILGLVGGMAVWVWNPVNSSDAPVYPTANRTINAAILSNAHTFQVQNYNVGSYRGLLSINGAIAQTYRGSVGMGNPSTGATTKGYKKDYKYDKRLRSIAPPKFLAPTSTTYGITQMGGVDSAFNVDGSCVLKSGGTCK